MQWLRVFWRVLFGMDALHACLALGPLAVYFLLIGTINLSRRPFLVSGTRDAAALGLALSGFVIVGPIELCLPDAAAVRFGPYVWLLLAGLYALCLVLGLLLVRPRLIVYNTSAAQLRAVLADLVDQLDADASWAGDVLVLPGLGVQLHLDHLAVMRNVSLTSVGGAQDPLGWHRLELALATALCRLPTTRNARGALLVAAGLLIILGLGYAVACDPRAVAQALFDMLRL
jgi:hypothetical protein